MRLVVCALVVAALVSACGGGASRSYESEPVAIDDGIPRGLADDSELIEAASTVTAARTEAATSAGQLSCLSTRLRAAQLLLPLASQPDLAEAHSFVVAGELGGIGLLDKRDAGVVRLLEELQELSPIPLMMASYEQDVLTSQSLSGLVLSDVVSAGAAIEDAFVAGADVVVLDGFAELAPALDYLVMRAVEDPAFASLIDSRAERVMTAKGQQSFCER